MYPIERNRWSYVRCIEFDATGVSAASPASVKFVEKIKCFRCVSQFSVQAVAIARSPPTSPNESVDAHNVGCNWKCEATLALLANVHLWRSCR